MTLINDCISKTSYFIAKPHNLTVAALCIDCDGKRILGYFQTYAKQNYFRYGAMTRPLMFESPKITTCSMYKQRRRNIHERKVMNLCPTVFQTMNKNNCPLEAVKHSKREDGPF